MLPTLLDRILPEIGSRSGGRARGRGPGAARRRCRPRRSATARRLPVPRLRSPLSRAATLRGLKHLLHPPRRRRTPPLLRGGDHTGRTAHRSDTLAESAITWCPRKRVNSIGRMPSWHQQINAVWLELALIAAELLALTQSMLLTGEPDLAWAGGPRRCATGCYTSPPGSPAANARCSCGWPSTGPGRSPSPKRSPGYGSSRSRPDPAGTPSRPPHQHHEDHGVDCR